MGTLIELRFIALVDGYVAAEPVAHLNDAIAQCQSFGDGPQLLEVRSLWTGRTVWRQERREQNATVAGRAARL